MFSVPKSIQNKMFHKNQLPQSKPKLLEAKQTSGRESGGRQCVLYHMWFADTRVWICLVLGGV